MSSLPLARGLSDSEAGGMFAIDCPGHGRRVLVPTSRISALRNTAAGIQVDLECWCGSRVTVHTGRRAGGPPGRAFPPALAVVG